MQEKTNLGKLRESGVFEVFLNYSVKTRGIGILCYLFNN